MGQINKYMIKITVTKLNKLVFLNVQFMFKMLLNP